VNDALSSSEPVAEEEAALSCPACDYDLRGQIEPRCPECGLRFSSLDELEEAARSAKRLYNRVLRSRLRVAILLGGAFAASFVAGMIADLFPNEVAVIVFVLVSLSLPTTSFAGFVLLVQVVGKRLDPRIPHRLRRELTGSIPVLIVFSAPFLLFALGVVGWLLL
jgi:hypothetical protein